MKKTIELDDKSDIALYKDFLIGNKEAFNLIIQKYRQPLIIFIMKYVKDIGIAEDLAQDTFLYIIINKKDYDFKYSLKTYLYTIAKCRALNYLKREKRIAKLNEKYTYDLNELDIEELLEKKEKKLLIFKALKNLKSDYQIAIYLKDLQEFKYSEICKILNKSLSQTKMLIHRARKALNKLLKEEDFLC